MKNKQKSVILIAVFVIVLIVVALVMYIETEADTGNEISNDYIAVFHGGVGELTYETYIYKIDNGHANMGFKYINVRSTSKYLGSTNWTHEIIDKGRFTWTDEAFKIAKKHGAYSYVTVPNEDRTYSIEEFQIKFIMD